MPIRQEFQQFLDDKAIPAYDKSLKGITSRFESGASRAGEMARTTAERYKRTGRAATRASRPFGRLYSSTIGRVGTGVSWVGQAMENLGNRAPWTTFEQAGAREIGGALSRRAGRLTRGVGNVMQKPVTTPVKFAAKAAWRAPGQGLKAAKAFRRGIKAIPKPVRKVGTVGGIALGLTAMLGVSVLKGAMNQGRQIAYDRYMQDATQSRNILHSTRLGNASGTNRMLGYGGTVGLSNSLSKTRHGRM